MNQEELLEEIWTRVIDAVDPDVTVEGRAGIEVRQVARLARFEAAFAWCYAFDEERLPCSTWVARGLEDPIWRNLLPEPAPAAPRAVRASGPFTDADAAHARLLEEGVTGAGLGAFLSGEARAALTHLRALLCEHHFAAGELAGLHEGLLSADPSGEEAGPGSWPRRRPPVDAELNQAGPILVLRRSHAMAFCPEGRRVVAAEGGRITEVATGACLATCRLLANTSHVVWSPDGRRIAAASTSGAIAICDPATGERLRVLGRTSEGPAPVFSADGEVVYAGGWDGAVGSWDVESGQTRARSRVKGAMVRKLERATDGRLFALVSYRPRPIALLVFSPELEPAGGMEIEGLQDIALDPTGGDHALALEFHALGKLSLAAEAWVERTETAAESIRFSPDARWFAATSRDGFIVGRASSLSTGTLIARRYASHAAFSPDSRRVALATWKKGEVWDVEELVRRHGA